MPGHIDGWRIVVATPGRGGEPVEIKYRSSAKCYDKGSFGEVFKGELYGCAQFVAIKKVAHDRRYMYRELEILMELSHPNVVELKYFFYTAGLKKGDRFLNLMMEFVPQTVHGEMMRYARSRRLIPLLYVKTYMYQMFRALGYIHSLGICHRDVKPTNLLVERESALLKLCDFGSAKRLVAGEPNVSYACSRYYRAPELLLGATDYSSQVDVWAAGCVVAEVLLGRVVFVPGISADDQLAQIVHVLGAPTPLQMHEMKAKRAVHNLPDVRARQLVLDGSPPEAVDLVRRLLVYSPAQRPSPLHACADAFFDELRMDDCRLPNGCHLPALFNWSAQELSEDASLNAKLVPAHEVESLTAADASTDE